MVDIKMEFLERAKATIGKSMDRMIKKEKITEDDKKGAMDRLNLSTDLSVAKDSQLVIEAVTENLKVKLEVFQQA